MSSTYNRVKVANTNAEKLLELWESFGATGLFRLEVGWGASTLIHEYHLKNSKIVISAVSNGPDHYELTIFDGGQEISAAEFWELLPKDVKKILAFHLDQLVV